MLSLAFSQDPFGGCSTEMFLQGMTGMWSEDINQTGKQVITPGLTVLHCSELQGILNSISKNIGIIF